MIRITFSDHTIEDIRTDEPIELVIQAIKDAWRAMPWGSFPEIVSDRRI
jgi:hypothetical protein